MFRFRLRKIWRWGLVLASAMVAIVFVINLRVGHVAQDKVFDYKADIPMNKVGLLLGTAKYLRQGGVNPYYSYRIAAAVRLYEAGKIKFVLVSGDNGTTQYDEPTTIKKDLIAQGIPESKIYLDYAGFRTLDSVIRCKEIFGQTSITVISQRFHNERAIYIASRKGINAVGYNAKDVRTSKGLKVQVREVFARVKMVLDLFFGKGPKFLGDKIEIK